MSATIAAPTSEMRRWWTLLAAGCALGMLTIDSTGTMVALPTIQRELGLSHGAQQWIITIYSLTLAAAITTGGRLGDIYGRVRIFTCGVTAFALGSMLSGLSPSLSLLLCGRLVEGLGNIMMAPAAALLATEAFGPEGRGRAMGIYTGLGGLAMTLGPIIAGVLVQHIGWRAVFFINLPLAIVTLVMLRVARPSVARPPASPFNAGYSVLLAAALGSIVLALQESHNWQWASPLTLGLLGFGLVLLAWFVRLQLRAADPLVDVKLLLNPRFAGDGVVLFCAQFSIIGQSAFGAIYLQRVLHFSPIQTGVAMLLLLGPTMACAPISGVLYDRFGVKVPAVLGLSLATLGFGLETQIMPRCDFAWLVPALLLIGAGMGLALSQTYTDGTSRVAPFQRGRAFGALDTLRQLGGAMGMAAIGTVVAAQERTRVLDIAGKALPPGVPRDQLDALMARAAYDQGGAVHILAMDWHAVGEALRLSAAQSIADGYYVGTAVLAVGLVLAICLMRRKTAAPGPVG